MSAIRSAMLLCLLLYWLMGVSGYAVYGEDTAGDILRNLDGVLMGNGNARMVKGIFGVNMLLLVRQCLFRRRSLTYRRCRASQRGF